MRWNAKRKKQLFVPPVTMAVPGMVRCVVALNEVLRKEVESKYSGDEPGIRR